MIKSKSSAQNSRKLSTRKLHTSANARFSSVAIWIQIRIRIRDLYLELASSSCDRDQIVYSTLRLQSIKNKTDRDHEPNS